MTLASYNLKHNKSQAKQTNNGISFLVSCCSNLKYLHHTANVTKGTNAHCPLPLCGGWCMQKEQRKQFNASELPSVPQQCGFGNKKGNQPIKLMPLIFKSSPLEKIGKKPRWGPEKNHYNGIGSTFVTNHLHDTQISCMSTALSSDQSHCRNTVL